MQISKYAAAIAIGLTVFAGQAAATESSFAQVSALKGAVAIEHGGTTSALTSGTALRSGDRIVSMEDGQAQIKFADGCVVPVQSNAVTVLGAQSPCAAMGLVGQSSPMSLSDENSLVIFGGIAFIAALALFFTTMIDDDHDSISP